MRISDWSSDVCSSDLALLSDTHVAEALTSGGADTDKLEAALKDYIRNHIQSIRDVEKHEVQPTLSFQRVLQRAIYHVQAAGKKQVSTLNVLVAIFSEKDTPEIGRASCRERVCQYV